MLTEIKCSNCPFRHCEDTNEFCRVYGAKVRTFINDDFEVEIKREDALKLIKLKENGGGLRRDE